VLAVAGIAAYVCYGHAYAVIRAHGQTGITALLEPATIDGLLYASSMLIWSAARHGSHAGGQRQDEGPDAGAVNDAAVAAYRLSVQAGSPLSECRLAQIFGRTSRRWARARIAEARQASLPQTRRAQCSRLTPEQGRSAVPPECDCGRVG
jgi:hypothetical protein